MEFVIFIDLVFKRLSQFHNSNRGFDRLIKVDSVHFLGPFILIFFLISPCNNSIFFFFYLVFFFQFHPSILNCLGIRLNIFFSICFFVELSQSHEFSFFFLDFNFKHWTCWKLSLVIFIFSFYEIIMISWLGSRI